MKVRVVHTGSRDHYHVAAAFAEVGSLERLVTSGYYKKSVLMALLGGEERFKNRSCEYLKDSEVQGHLFVDAIKVFSRNSDNVFNFSRTAEMLLGRLSARNSENIDVIIAYNYMAHNVFPFVTAKRVLFQCHPNPIALESNLFKSIDLDGTGFSMEREIAWGRDYKEKLESEWNLADHIIVASSFVKQSLINAGASADIISIAPYGSSQIDGQRVRVFPERTRLRALFVGQLVWRKGADLLIEFAKSNVQSVELTVVTRGLFDQKIFEGLAALSNVDIHQSVSSVELDMHYLQSDILLFPSRFEGYGLVINEALSRGLPVISTFNTAFADIFTSYRAGQLMTRVDTESLSQAMEKLQCKKNYEEASAEALRFASSNTWSDFRARIREVVLGVNN